jgi:hypothetical protein
MPRFGLFTLQSVQYISSREFPRFLLPLVVEYSDVVEVECSTANGTFKWERSIPAKEERMSGAAFGSAFGQLSLWFQDNAGR